MTRQRVQAASGFRDFIQVEAKVRLRLLQLIAETYMSFGFLPIETPALESLQILGGSAGEENEKLIFKVLKRGAKLEASLKDLLVQDFLDGAKNQTQPDKLLADFGLRFDMTVPLSRLVAAERARIRFPWKVFHSGPVWRAERAQKGRFREFIQSDVDILGVKAPSAELEVITAVLSVLERLNLKDFTLKINDRRLLDSLAQKLGFQQEQFAAFAILLDKKDKLPEVELRRELLALRGQALSHELLEVIFAGDLDLADVRQFVGRFHPQAAEDLEWLVSGLAHTTGHDNKLAGLKVKLDPSLARGMGYYTGMIFELTHPSANYAFGGGGRYDGLIGRLAGQEIPACGMSLGFERLALLLSEKEQKEKLNADILFIPVLEESLRFGLMCLAANLRQMGLKVSLYPGQLKKKTQLQFASDLGHRFVLLIEASGWQKQLFLVKDFQSGEENQISSQELGSFLLKLIKIV